MKQASDPFFFLHGDWYGGGFYSLNLVQGVGKAQPFYVLEPYEFERSQSPISFEQVAAEHIKTMRTVQAEGPYLMGGFCNGGLMAYEMARQLRAAGEAVDLLVLIDPATIERTGPLHRILDRLGSLLRLKQNLLLNWFLRYLYLRIPSYRRKVQETASKAIKQASIAARDWQGWRNCSSWIAGCHLKLRCAISGRASTAGWPVAICPAPIPAN